MTLNVKKCLSRIMNSIVIWSQNFANTVSWKLQVESNMRVIFNFAVVKQLLALTVVNLSEIKIKKIINNLGHANYYPKNLKVQIYKVIYWNFKRKKKKEWKRERKTSLLVKNRVDYKILKKIKMPTNLGLIKEMNNNKKKEVTREDM